MNKNIYSQVLECEKLKSILTSGQIEAIKGFEIEEYKKDSIGFYIYFSDNRPLIQSDDLQGLFKKFIIEVRNEKSDNYISFGINQGINSCDLAYSEYVKSDNKSHVVFSNDNFKSRVFNTNLVNVNIKNIMLEML